MWVGRREMVQATVYQKHMALQNLKMKYKAWHLPGAGRLRGGVSTRSQESGAKHWIEAPVNGGRNYNGPKVAKFLVG